ncbi:F-box domain-containing protein [Mycena venus]|uniref:F-box domain-containing protein n=1 Tax=Mycena venus TaxID=2733690 RepID=A0A8H6XCB3_9AGAR|nr:F-box domain-containing protein [Mycena venus]
MDDRFLLPAFTIHALNASTRVRNVYYASHRVELIELYSEIMETSVSSSSPGPDAYFEQNIRNLIQQSESNLQAIDAEIARLRSLLEVQYHLRELEHEKLASLRSEIAPIRQVPVELLAKIFLLSLETESSSQLCISQVSQHWRRVAHSTPRLWCRLSLEPPYELPDDYLDLTKAWIDRSSSLPLSLRVLPKGGEYNSHLASFLSALLSVAHRWQKLETTPEVIYYLPSLPPDAFASLEELHFESSWPHISDLDIRAFSTAPRLRCFSNLNVGMRVGSGPTYHMPWKQLTELGISLQAPLCRSILLSCESVETVKLQARGLGEIAPLPAHTLPRLKYLHASFDDIAVFFLDSLALPVLETLTLDIPWDETPGLAATITQLHLRSPNIQTLNLLKVYLNSA